MKYAPIALLLLMLAAPGCVTLPNLGDQPPPPTPAAEKEPVKTAAPTATPVKAEDITEQNAHQMANLLQAEMDRATSEASGEGKPVKVRP